MRAYAHLLPTVHSQTRHLRVHDTLHLTLATTTDKAGFNYGSRVRAFSYQVVIVPLGHVFSSRRWCWQWEVHRRARRRV